MLTYYLQLGPSAFGLGFLAKNLNLQYGVQIHCCKFENDYHEEGKLFFEALAKTKFYKVTHSDDTNSVDYDVQSVFNYTDEEHLREVIVTPEILYINSEFSGKIYQMLPKVISFLHERDNIGKPTYVLKDAATPFNPSSVKEMDVILHFYAPMGFEHMKLVNFSHDILESRLTVKNFYPEIYLEKKFRCAFYKSDLNAINDIKIRGQIHQSFTYAEWSENEYKFLNFSDKKKYRKLVLQLLAYFSEAYRFPFINKFILTKEGVKKFKESTLAIQAIHRISKEEALEEWKSLYERITEVSITTEQFLPWIFSGKPTEEELYSLAKEYHADELFTIDYNQIAIILTFFKRIGGIPPLK